ncbi:hypothetical protein ACMHYJ_14360 [Castellaniella hirudinis]|uniref:hypothetical protein n=1 Tax=Castellaniella hirudinis TaxID=1144617 RepID=UPI0039C3FF0C
MSNHEDDFCKIIRASSGRQVLVFLSSDEDGNPSVDVSMQYDGILLHVNNGFGDEDAGHKARDAMFAGYGQAEADNFERGLIEFVGEKS